LRTITATPIATATIETARAFIATLHATVVGTAQLLRGTINKAINVTAQAQVTVQAQTAYKRTLEAVAVATAIMDPIRVMFINALVTGTATITKVPNKVLQALVWVFVKLKKPFYKTKYEKQNNNYTKKY